VTIQAVIFDLDGVIVSTDAFHYRAWKRMADEEGIYFDEQINHRLRGVSRMDSLAIILERAERNYTDADKQAMAERKNEYYRELLETLRPGQTLPGAMDVVHELKRRGIKVAVASSSRNAGTICQKLGISDEFDAHVDGNDIQRSKPDPQVFMLAAQRLGVPPEQCLVVEDAEAGVDAALAGGMKPLGVGAAQHHPGAHAHAADLSAITVDRMLNV